ncbi:MAG TPA: DNA polymerase sliding clamp [Marine Group III euryarchaeote]|uniref:DNA polymerase sliding clamp n=1 Tax=Marine Group III euryarchaeote TaxID=2173149 RepID=A0A7C7KJC0_9ARCH|nr:DNA polymerase sliding clamp [Marine Group III euryarchaeote]HIC62569.1 DNA polymerase sliding clamp [Marine Group III euryarchaeote]
MFKARIKADNLKEFIGTVGSLVDEAKLNVNEDGMQIKAVDPSHVAMIEANLIKSAFDSYEADVAEMGIDVDKFKTVLTVAGKEDMVSLEKDDKLNRLVVNIGNLTRAMPLLDTSGMPDPKVPSLDLPAFVSVSVEEISQGLKASKSVSDHIALSTTKDSFRLVCEGDNQNRVDLTLGKEQLEKLVSPEETTSLFSLEYFALMVNSLPPDRILHINLGTDLPVKVDADLAIEDLTGAQGNVKFLLAPRIDRE